MFFYFQGYDFCRIFWILFTSRDCTRWMIQPDQGWVAKGMRTPANVGSAVWIIHWASRVSVRNGGNSYVYIRAGSWPILQFLWYPERALVSLYNRTECRRSTNGGTKPSFGAICRAVYLRLVIADISLS